MPVLRAVRPLQPFYEPLPLLLLELCFWAIIALAEALTIAWIIE